MNDEIPAGATSRWEGWAIVEQMGRIRVIGYVTDVDYFGVRFAHVETPAVGEIQGRTRNVAGSTIFAFSPADKAEIMAELEQDWQHILNRRLQEDQRQRERESREKERELRQLGLGSARADTDFAGIHQMLRQQGSGERLEIDLDSMPFGAGSVRVEEEEEDTGEDTTATLVNLDGLLDGDSRQDQDGGETPPAGRKEMGYDF